MQKKDKHFRALDYFNRHTTIKRLAKTSYVPASLPLLSLQNIYSPQ